MASLANVRAAHQSHAEPATITTLAAAQARFTERYREFVSKTRRYFDDCTPELRDDRTSRSLAFAWKAIVRELQRGKLTDARMYSCLRFAWKRIRTGKADYRGDGKRPRDLYSRWHRDAYHDDRRRAPAPGEHQFDVLVNALTEYPSSASSVLDIVAFRLDTPRWLDSLTPEMRERAIDLGMGWKPHECAVRWHVSRAAVSITRRQLWKRYNEFHSR
jgi:hypothetical protein